MLADVCPFIRSYAAWKAASVAAMALRNHEMLASAAKLVAAFVHAAAAVVPAFMWAIACIPSEGPDRSKTACRELENKSFRTGTRASARRRT